jgi:hypothetical protein
MSTQPLHPAEPRPPKCPNCKEFMPMVVLYPYQIGKLLLPTAQCPWCAVMLHMHVIITPDDAEPPEEKPPLWKPS